MWVWVYVVVGVGWMWLWVWCGCGRGYVSGCVCLFVTVCRLKYGASKLCTGPASCVMVGFIQSHNVSDIRFI